MSINDNEFKFSRTRVDPSATVKLVMTYPLKIFNTEIGKRSEKHINKMEQIARVALKVFLKNGSIEDIAKYSQINLTKWCHRQAVFQAAKVTNRTKETLIFYSKLKNKQYSSIPHF